jgi:hypothetical protein
METKNNYNLIPTYRRSFGTGWQVMKDNFLRLFLVIIVLAVLAAPFKMMDFKIDPSDFQGPWDWGGDWEKFIGWGAFGMLAGFFGMIAVLYAFLVAPVFKFGGDLIFVHAVRQIKPDFELLIKGFSENYLFIILANLLAFALVILGLFALIIPGIIIACRLVFVSYIIMDKKTDPIEAVELSWKLTRGHGWRIFLMGFTSFFIVILGLCLVIVGVFPALIWVASSFASLYQSVLLEKEKPVEETAVA